MWYKRPLCLSLCRPEVSMHNLRRRLLFFQCQCRHPQSSKTIDARSFPAHGSSAPAYFQRLWYCSLCKYTEICNILTPPYHGLLTHQTRQMLDFRPQKPWTRVRVCAGIPTWWCWCWWGWGGFLGVFWPMVKGFVRWALLERRAERAMNFEISIINNFAVLLWAPTCISKNVRYWCPLNVFYNFSYRLS